MENRERDLESLSYGSNESVHDSTLKKASQMIGLKQSVSVEAYHKRGLIKEGELIEKPKELLFAECKPQDVKSVETNAGIVDVYGNEGLDGIFMVAPNQTLDAEEIEQLLLKTLSNSPNKFNDKNVTIYAFAPFLDAAVKDIVAGDYYEFKGRFEFIKAMRGWVLLSYNRAVRLSE